MEGGCPASGGPTALRSPAALPAPGTTAAASISADSVTGYKVITAAVVCLLQITSAC